MDSSPHSHSGHANDPADVSPNQAELHRRLVHLHRELNGLRTAYCAGLLAMILVCVSVALFLYRQTSVIRSELAGRTQQVLALRREYVSKEPMLRDFISRLQAFSANYKDFQPLLAKHQAVVNQFSAPPASAPPK